MEMGWNVVNVEYRLGPNTLAPGAVEDCFCALRYTAQQAMMYNIDVNRMVVTGESAGGHLALSLGILPESEGFDRECAAAGPMPKVAAVINWFGITDVPDVIDGPHRAAAAVRWFGSMPNPTRMELAKRVSPLTYVRAGLPPILTVHGDADTTVPYPEAVALHQALAKVNVPNQLVTISGGKHGNFTPQERDRIYLTIREFLGKTALPRLVAVLAIAVAASTSVFAADRQLLNDWDVRSEIALAPGVDPSAVKEYFPSFYEYLDIVLFHPTAGYYSSGRVNFSSDYRTFPGALAPSFGQMVAEQVFRMWDGMRKAGTLGPTEKFTIAEFGAGDGALAESILDYIDHQAAVNPDTRWRAFKEQAVYACYDRSPALSEQQRKRNARFGSRFEARRGDATTPGLAIPRGSLKGVVLSNELPDCFSVHKVILSESGSAEVAFTVPSLQKSAWSSLEKSLSPASRQLITKDDESIRNKLFGAKNGGKTTADGDLVYLSRAGFSAVLDAFNHSGSYESDVNRLQFQELYVPASVFPDLAEHFRQYARAYAYRLAKGGKGMVAYINLGEGTLIQGAGAALKAGYVITIDYGSNWDGILAQDFDHLRMYGPGSSQFHANPYHAPTLNDMTTDVNFSHLAAEGKSVGLQPLYFGPQYSLQTGTPIKIDEAPAGHSDPPDFLKWADLFYSWEAYKVLIQQKENTDAAYHYPGEHPEALVIAEDGLSASERTRMAEIEKKLGH
jgi:SAM-dependent MidA family methyltransferase/acetyl esterase/lipase